MVWKIIGQILHGQVIQRQYVSLDQTTGSSLIDFNVPSLTLAGDMDGLMRVTRVAEAYYHTQKNVN